MPSTKNVPPQNPEYLVPPILLNKEEEEEKMPDDSDIPLQKDILAELKKSIGQDPYEETLTLASNLLLNKDLTPDQAEIVKSLIDENINLIVGISFPVACRFIAAGCVSELNFYLSKSGDEQALRLANKLLKENEEFDVDHIIKKAIRSFVSGNINKMLVNILDVETYQDLVGELSILEMLLENDKPGVLGSLDIPDDFECF